MRSILAAAAALALAGCTVYSSPKPVQCGGTKVATLRFSGPITATTCPFATNSGVVHDPVGFTGEVYWDPAGTAAAICIPEPHAEPHIGTHTGYSLSVTNVNIGPVIPGCSTSCLVENTETIAGTLQFQGAEATGFTGTLTNTVRPSPLVAPPTPGDCGCGLPCVITYDLAGSP